MPAFSKPVSSKKRAAPADSTTGHPNKVSRAEQQNDAVSKNPGEPQKRIRPARANAGQGGQARQLARVFDNIRPDLRPRQVQANNEFPNDATENSLAPPLPAARSRGSKSTSNQSNSTSQKVMNAIPRPSSEASLAQAPAPQFQRNTAGSRFGFGVGESIPNNQVNVNVNPSSAVNPVHNEADSQHTNPETLRPQGDQASGYPQAYSQNNHQLHNVDGFNFPPIVHPTVPQYSQNPSPILFDYQQHQNLNLVSNLQHQHPHNFGHYDQVQGESRQYQGREYESLGPMFQEHIHHSEYRDAGVTETSGNSKKVAQGEDDNNGDESDGNNLNDVDDQNDSETEEDEDEEGGDQNDKDRLGSGINIIDELSPDEDERNALNVISNQNNNQGKNICFDDFDDDHNAGINDMPDGEDVLEVHRQTNKAQRSPRPESFAQKKGSQAKINEKSITHYNSNDASDESQADHDPRSYTQTRKTKKIRKSKSESDDKKPINLGYYDEQWKAILQEAQDALKIHCLTTAKHPFLTVGEHLPDAQKILFDIIAKHLNSGAVINQMYEQSRDMTLCVFNILSSWRGTLKDFAMMQVMTGYYKEIHCQDAQDNNDDDYLLGEGNQEGMAEIIRRNVSDLLSGSRFLRNGTDIQGKTRNFAHPAIGKVIQACFYDNSKKKNKTSLAMVDLTNFQNTVPDKAVALACCLIKSCLKDYLANPLKVSRSKFDGKDWIGTFNLYMSSIDILKRNSYHRAKYEADCASWAREGMRMIESDGLEDNLSDVELILD